jgi:DNA topoisomerase-2
VIIKRKKQSFCFFNYSGYRGTVKRIDQHNFVSSGELSVLSPTTLEITELPIGVSAKIYKDSVLETLLCGSEGISALITDFKEFHKHNTVRFVITMTEQKMQQAEAEGFHKAFQLQISHSQKPTLLYDSNGSLRMYGSANEVLKAFFEVRLGLYRKRKEYLTDLIQAHSKCLTNQTKFIREVCDNVYNFNLNEVRSSHQFF